MLVPGESHLLALDGRRGGAADTQRLLGRVQVSATLQHKGEHTQGVLMNANSSANIRPATAEEINTYGPMTKRNMSAALQVRIGGQKCPQPALKRQASL